MIDLAKILEGVLKTTNAGAITNLFLFIIIIVFISALILAVLGKGRIFTNYTPGLLTSLGILGTFIGIVIGLLDFDPVHIDESIELLLNGLKTAFITSLAGMAGAIAYKLVGTTPLFKANQISNIAPEVEPKDILRAIDNQSNHLIELKKAISGDEESSLAGQMRLLRSDINDNHKVQQRSFEEFSEDLWVNLKDFSELLSKSATEQVIEARLSK